MSECNSDCGSCSSNCADRTKESNFEKTHELSNVKKVIGIVSGKGGVGKSSVTSMLATLTRRMGFNTAILDADITGPSIPKAFGIKGHAEGSEAGLIPMLSKTGIEVMSTNLLLENETDPVVWRGPVIAGMVKQFWTDVIWNEVDFMFIDMPPGTGDVPLTVYQSIPVDGIIIVTSPQELVGMIVEKAVNMANKMNIKVLGIVENLSYFVCPDNGKKYNIFGKSKVEEVAQKHKIKNLAKLPIKPEIAELCDSGNIELFEGDELNGMVSMITSL